MNLCHVLETCWIIILSLLTLAKADKPKIKRQIKRQIENKTKNVTNITRQNWNWTNTKIKTKIDNFIVVWFLNDAL